MSITRRSLNLDFVRDGKGSGLLDPLFTFTRASTATRINASGLLETVAADTPRFDFDPVTLECKGLLIEEGRTNICLHSSNFANAIYNNGTLAAPTANYGTAPDGSSSAARSNTLGNRYQLLTVTPGATYTTSCWIKLLAGSGVVDFYTINGGGVSVAPTSSWQRVQLSDVASGSTGYIGINLVSGTLDVLIWGLQAELGSFATSYIPTTSAAVTRAGETLAILTVDPWYAVTEGTWLIEASIPSATGIRRTLLHAANATDSYSPLISAEASDGIRGLAIVSGVYVFDQVQGAVAATTKAALIYKSGAYRYSVDGITLTGSTPSIPIKPTQVGIGCRYTPNEEHANGHIRRFTYLPFAVDDLTLKQMTV